MADIPGRYKIRLIKLAEVEQPKPFYTRGYVVQELRAGNPMFPYLPQPRQEQMIQARMLELNGPERPSQPPLPSPYEQRYDEFPGPNSSVRRARK